MVRVRHLRGRETDMWMMMMERRRSVPVPARLKLKPMLTTSNERFGLLVLDRTPVPIAQATDALLSQVTLEAHGRFASMIARVGLLARNCLHTTSHGSLGISRVRAKEDSRRRAPTSLQGKSYLWGGRIGPNSNPKPNTNTEPTLILTPNTRATPKFFTIIGSNSLP